MYLPPWPKNLPRVLKPIATFKHKPFDLDRLALQHAHQLQREANQVQCSALTQTWAELIFSNRSDFNAMNNQNTEQTIIAGLNLQPTIPALFFDANRGFGRSISIRARGVLGTTSTPTIIFQVRMGTTQGSSNLGGASIGVSVAITTASGVTNKWWDLGLDLTCYTPGQGSGNSTISGGGWVTSPGGFASPFIYPLEPTTPDTATWTQTFDDTVTQYINLSATWSAASSSNTITVKNLWMFGWN